MPETYFADFRDYLDFLDKRGKLHRWSRPVNKDTEMMPLMRLQYRGIADEQRKVFLFENVRDSRGRKHGIQVATGMYGSSRPVVALGLGAEVADRHVLDHAPAQRADGRVAHREAPVSR